MVEAYVKLYKLKDSTTQTDDLNFNLTLKKTVRMYFSQAYKEKVLSLNFGTSKNYIITKHMWQNFKKEFDNIENVFETKSQNGIR
jgi:predicted GNAT superfamily acetyltransferase